MNVINTHFEFVRVSSSEIGKTSSKVLKHLLDLGIEIDSKLNTIPLKLKRLKLSHATRKQYHRKDDYMDINESAVPIPNVIDYNLLLLEEDPRSYENLKTVCIHTVTSKQNFTLFFSYFKN